MKLWNIGRLCQKEKCRSEIFAFYDGYLVAFCGDCLCRTVPQKGTRREGGQGKNGRAPARIWDDEKHPKEADRGHPARVSQHLILHRSSATETRKEISGLIFQFIWAFEPSAAVSCDPDGI